MEITALGCMDDHGELGDCGMD